MGCILGVIGILFALAVGEMLYNQSPILLAVMLVAVAGYILWRLFKWQKEKFEDDKYKKRVIIITLIVVGIGLIKWLNIEEVAMFIGIVLFALAVAYVILSTLWDMVKKVWNIIPNKRKRKRHIKEYEESEQYVREHSLRYKDIVSAMIKSRSTDSVRGCDYALVHDYGYNLLKYDQESHEDLLEYFLRTEQYSLMSAVAQFRYIYRRWNPIEKKVERILEKDYGDSYDIGEHEDTESRMINKYIKDHSPNMRGTVVVSKRTLHGRYGKGSIDEPLGTSDDKVFDMEDVYEFGVNLFEGHKKSFDDMIDFWMKIHW